ncbi:trypsin-1-like isoform X2 [Oratosquilla oratoria]|uniref:trypsin-1-like isoform X2 n=1 Tax=Oratosquilla oratoria TaxID=337810 RepID=UPI003F75A246
MAPCVILENKNADYDQRKLSPVPARKPYLFRGLNRIVGGTKAAPGEIPYQVSFQDISYGFDFHFCGGAVYSNNYVITAAHCVDGEDPENPNNLKVVVGELNLSLVETTEQDVKVSGIVQHEDYNGYTIENDIALLRLASPLAMNSYVQPIALPEPGFTAIGECVVSGWGTTSEGGSASNDLLKVSVPILKDDRCRDLYGSANIVDSMICAGYPAGGKDSCQGDSGGPLACGGPGSSRYLAGVVSWGYGCARPDYPGVYTEVSYFVDWIKAKAV